MYKLVFFRAQWSSSGRGVVVASLSHLNILNRWLNATYPHSRNLQFKKLEYMPFPSTTFSSNSLTLLFFLLIIHFFYIIHGYIEQGTVGSMTFKSFLGAGGQTETAQLINPIDLSILVKILKILIWQIVFGHIHARDLH